MKLRKKVPPLVTVKSDSIGFPPQDFRPRIFAPVPLLQDTERLV